MYDSERDGNDPLWYDRMPPDEPPGFFLIGIALLFDNVRRMFSYLTSADYRSISKENEPLNCGDT